VALRPQQFGRQRGHVRVPVVVQALREVRPERAAIEFVHRRQKVRAVAVPISRHVRDWPYAATGRFPNANTMPSMM